MKLLTMRLVAVLLSVATFASACGNDADDKSAKSGTIRVAVLMPQSGPTEPIGKAYAATVQYLADQVDNEGGVLVNGTKYKLDLKVFDDGGTAEVAQRAVREAVDQDYQFMIGPFGSAATAGVVSLMAQNDMVWMVNSNVAGPTVNQRAFRSTMLQANIDGQFISWLSEHPEVKRVAVTTDGLFTGAAERTDDFIKEVEQAGAEVVASEPHQLGDTDLRPIITKMKAKNPDVYLIRGYPTTTPVFVGQVRELAGAEPLIAFQPPLTTAETKKAFPDQGLLDRVITIGGITGFDPFVNEKDERATKVNAELGSASGSFSVWAYDSFEIFLEALRKADSPTSEAVAAALKDLKAEDVADKTFNTFEARESGLLFGADREVDLVGATLVWTPAGWTRDGQ